MKCSCNCVMCNHCESEDLLECHFCDSWICKEHCIDHHGFKCVETFRTMEKLGYKFQ